MSEYDSLAEQVELDFKTIMVALRGIKKDVQSIETKIDTASESMVHLNGTVRKLLIQGKTTVNRLDKVEQRVDTLEKKSPPAA